MYIFDETYLLEKPKTGGKNKSSYDGFYTKDGKSYFIKVPANKTELFAELFAGRLFDAFIQYGLISDCQACSFITAKLIRLPDGSYGLIQPKVAFTEVFKIIDTGVSDGSDRSALWEMLFGPAQYLLLHKKFSKLKNLLETLFFSLWIGDYSVHSANLVVLEQEEEQMEEATVARIDLGAAFRDFAEPSHSEDNEDILTPYEDRGWLNYRMWFKQYFYNFILFPGLFGNIAAYAKDLKSSVDPVKIQLWVVQILKELPSDFLSEQDLKEIASYIHLPSFVHIYESDEAKKIFAADFTKILMIRLDKIGAVKNLTPLPDKFDILPENIGDLALILDTWNEQINLSTDTTQVVCTEQQLQKLEILLKSYVTEWSAMGNALQLWDDQACFYQYLSKPKLLYYPSIILRRMVLGEELGHKQFAEYAEAVRQYCYKNSDSFFSLCVRLLKEIKALIEGLKNIPFEDSSEQLSFIKIWVEQIMDSKKQLLRCIEQGKQDQIPAYNAPFFPMSRNQLLKLDAKDLVVLLYEEMAAGQLSENTAQIIVNDALWERFIEGAADFDTEELLCTFVPESIELIKSYRIQFEQYKALFTLKGGLNAEELSLKFSELPEFLRSFLTKDKFYKISTLPYFFNTEKPMAEKAGDTAISEPTLF